MGNLGQVFDFSGQSAASKSDFDPLPPGWYAVEVTSGEVKTTKAGNGTRVAIRFDVRGGAHDGRVVFGSFNLTNPNPKAAEIGREQLGQLSVACASNDVRGYRAIKGALPAVPSFARAAEREAVIDAATAEAPKAPAKSPPWVKRVAP